jgi:hypothetical protein
VTGGSFVFVSCFVAKVLVLDGIMMIALLGGVIRNWFSGACLGAKM